MYGLHDLCQAKESLWTSIPVDHNALYIYASNAMSGGWYIDECRLLVYYMGCHVALVWFLIPIRVSD